MNLLKTLETRVQNTAEIHSCASVAAGHARMLGC
jgi:hypothetical protein